MEVNRSYRSCEESFISLLEYELHNSWEILNVFVREKASKQQLKCFVLNQESIYNSDDQELTD